MFLRRILTITAFLIFLAGTAQAAIISYKVTNLPDTTVGEDLWQVSFTVSDYSFNPNFGFQIFFDYGNFKNITPVSTSGGWDAIAFDPDLILGLSADGVYDAMALLDNASLATPFVVNFTWLGTEIPEIHYLKIYDDNFAVVESGQIVVQIESISAPGPSTILLIVAVILGMLIRNRFIEIKEAS